MIPKIIHYCWFGKNQYNEVVMECINSWKNILTDYELKLWNEDNFDVNQCAFSKKAYDNKKWAFVSDYARLKVIYEYGGIYFDTDVEVIKRFDELLKYPHIFSLYVGHKFNGGTYMCEPHNPLIGKMIEWYETHEFTDDLSEDCLMKYNNINIITDIAFKYFNVNILKDISKYDYNINTINVLPNEYFCPLSEYWYKYSYAIHRYTNFWKK